MTLLASEQASCHVTVICMPAPHLIGLGSGVSFPQPGERRNLDLDVLKSK